MAAMTDLSAELLAEIVKYLLAGVSELAYILELRLTCSRFNDALIHELFSTSAYKFVIDQRETSRFDYTFSAHDNVPKHLQLRARSKTVNPAWVKRRYLQGRINKPSSSDDERVVLFQRLRAAARYLETLSEEDVEIRHDMQRALSHLDPVPAKRAIQDLGNSAVCEATLLFFDNHSEAILDERRRLCHVWVRDAESSDWLVNVACWSGSIVLLRRLQSEAQQPPMNPSSFRVSALQCMPTAIRQGHHSIVQYILEQTEDDVLLEYGGLTSSIEAALLRGNLALMDQMLERKSTNTTQRRIYNALSRARPSQGRFTHYTIALAHLLRLHRRRRTDEQSMLTVNVVEAGGFIGLKLLAECNQLCGRLLDKTSGQYSALDIPSRAGDASTLSELFRMGYCKGCEPEAVDIAITRAAMIALAWNHGEVFEELSKHSDVLGTPRWLPYLAASDGALLRLRKLCDSAEILESPVFTDCELKTKQDTIGQAALELAMGSLRYENVYFLLNLGIRLSPEHQVVRTSWSYAKYHQAALYETQRILLSFERPGIEICV